jgi:hypothetical protein
MKAFWGGVLLLALPLTAWLVGPAPGESSAPASPPAGALLPGRSAPGRVDAGVGLGRLAEGRWAADCSPNWRTFPVGGRGLGGADPRKIVTTRLTDLPGRVLWTASHRFFILL